MMQFAQKFPRPALPHRPGERKIIVLKQKNCRVLLVVELAMGLISRAAPMLNLMSVGTPIRLIVGLLVVAAVVSVAPSVIARFAPVAMDIGVRAARAFR